MAKNNIFLGTAKGSVGDVTLYRRDGAEVARVRVRDIANPRTTGQSVQRNFLAPVARFYSPLAVTLEKSYEGLNKMKSYAAFLKANIELARKNGWYLPKGTPFFPLPYKLSRGTLKPTICDYNKQAGQLAFSWFNASDFDSRTETTIANLSSAFIFNGYKEGDVVTLIAVGKDDEGNYVPGSYQFEINLSDTTNFVNANGVHFQYESGRLYAVVDNLTIVAAAVIVSRFENGIWRRSTQNLVVDTDIMAQVLSETQRINAITSYSNTANSSDGNVYLDGDGKAFNVAADSGEALLYIGGQSNVSRTTAGSGQALGFKPTNRDTYFFVKNDKGQYLAVAGTSDPITAATFVTDAPADVTAENTITLDKAGVMQAYLQSIGIKSSVFDA